jgi:hypothetical protein
MVTVHNLDHESVAKMMQVDLATMDREPESPIAADLRNSPSAINEIPQLMDR